MGYLNDTPEMGSGKIDTNLPWIGSGKIDTNPPPTPTLPTTPTPTPTPTPKPPTTGTPLSGTLVNTKPPTTTDPPPPKSTALLPPGSQLPNDRRSIAPKDWDYYAYLNAKGNEDIKASWDLNKDVQRIWPDPSEYALYHYATIEKDDRERRLQRMRQYIADLNKKPEAPTFEMPTFEMPSFEMPTFQMPTFPQYQLPAYPTMPTAPTDPAPAQQPEPRNKRRKLTLLTGAKGTDDGSGKLGRAGTGAGQGAGKRRLLG